MWWALTLPRVRHSTDARVVRRGVGLPFLIFLCQAYYVSGRFFGLFVSLMLF